MMPRFARACACARMPPRRLRCLLPILAVGLALSSTSCTLAKPVVCAVTTPIYVLGNSDTCGCDPRGALCGLLVISAVGAAGGLVTGIISDINYLTGDVEDPCRNLHDPFATNTSAGSF